MTDVAIPRAWSEQRRSPSMTHGQHIRGSIQRGSPGVGSWETQRAQIAARRRPAGTSSPVPPPPFAAFRGSGLVTFSSLIRPSSWAMPRLSRNGAHHRPLALEVVVHQRARRHRVRNVRQRRQVLRLLLDRQTDDALRPEFHVGRECRRRLRAAARLTDRPPRTAPLPQRVDPTTSASTTSTA